MKARIIAAAVVIALAVAFAPVGTSQQAVDKTSLLDTACTTARQVGILGGANIEKCRLVSQMDEGQTALITVKVKVSGQGWFAVALAYQRTVWSQSAMSITPVTP